MKVYRSKIGPGLVIPLAVILGSVLGLAIYEQTWLGMCLVLIPVAFITHMFLTTYYTIQEGILKINCGFLYRNSITIATIQKIEENKTGLSSPAASFDRIEIMYNKFDSVLISPKDKAGFIQHLLSINPSITVRIKSSE